MTNANLQTPAANHTLARIAALVGGTVVGDAETPIMSVATIDEAQSGDLVFAESERYLMTALASKASAVLAPPQAAALPSPPKPLILVDNPRLAFVQALEALAPPLHAEEGIHPTAIVDADADIAESVSIGAHVTVEAGARLGTRVILFPGVRVGANCVIGDDTVLYPNVVLYPRVTVGRRCILHAGCVIGADGFGYIPIGPALKKVPHLGTVQIADDVEIGANSTIDRSKTGATVIGAGTKIDNLVHVGHNVRVGASCLLVAQVGIGGSVTIGNGVILAGQAGLKDHITVGDGARIAAQSGVIGNVAAGATLFGYPARPAGQKMREEAAAALLPEYIKRIRALEKRLNTLEERNP